MTLDQRLLLSGAMAFSFLYFGGALATALVAHNLAAVLIVLAALGATTLGYGLQAVLLNADAALPVVWLSWILGVVAWADILAEGFR